MAGQTTKTSDDILIVFPSSIGRPTKEFPLAITLSDQSGKGWRYPSKVEHVMPLPTSSEAYLAGLPHKQRRKIVARVEKAQAQFQVSIEKVSAENYDQWLPYYRQFIGQKRGAKLHATPERLSEFAQTGWIIWVLNSQGQPVSGAVFEIFPDSLKIKWRWNNPDFLAQGSSTLLVWNLIQLAIEKRLPHFRFGADTNLYGGHLSAGLRTFKLQWGTHAVAAPTAKWYWVKASGAPRDGGLYVEQEGTLRFISFGELLAE